MGRIGDPRNIEPLLAALEDEDGFVRLQSAGAWREITDRHTLRTVIAALGDKEWPVRSAAAKMLGEIGDPRAVDPLLAALQDPRIQGEAALALGRIGDRRAVEVLVPLLWENPRSDLGWNVLRALRVLDPHWRDTDAAAQLVPDALASLQDENEFVRGDAAWFLGYAADARAIEPLMVA